MLFGDIELKRTEARFGAEMEKQMKADILDLLKVNIPSWLTVGWVQSVDLNTVIQEVGTSLLIVLAVFYSFFKLMHMFLHVKWAKEDRENGQ